MLPDIAYMRDHGFPVGTVVGKILFTTATVAEVPYLQDPIEWTAFVTPTFAAGDSTRRPQAVRLIQMDIMVRDDCASDTGGWVCGTFVYNGALGNENRWRNLVPVGLMWGNDPAVRDTIVNERPVATIVNPNVRETVINPSRDLPPTHLGWGMRLSGGAGRGPDRAQPLSLVTRGARPAGCPERRPAPCCDVGRLHHHLPGALRDTPACYARPRGTVVFSGPVVVGHSSLSRGWIMHLRNIPGLFSRFTLAVTAAALLLTFTAACGDDAPTGPVAFGKAAYIRSEVGQPWGQATNEDAMDQAFGVAQWDDLRFETLGVASLASNYTFLFLDGSDDGADELEAFIAANQVALEAFVASGRRVLINSAPNEGDGMSFGFGVTLVDNQSTSDVEAVSALHPIFAATVTTAFSGSSFGHATVSGTGLTAIIQGLGDPTKVVLAETTLGRGTALFGGMTTDNFHLPQPDAHTLRINILRYASGLLP